MGQMFILTLKVMLSSRMQVLLQHVYIILGLQRKILKYWEKKVESQAEHVTRSFICLQGQTFWIWIFNFDDYQRNWCFRQCMYLFVLDLDFRMCHSICLVKQMRSLKADRNSSKFIIWWPAAAHLCCQSVHQDLLKHLSIPFTASGSPPASHKLLGRRLRWSVFMKRANISFAWTGHESNSYLSQIWEIMSQQVYGESCMTRIMHPFVLRIFLVRAEEPPSFVGGKRTSGEPP